MAKHQDKRTRFSKDGCTAFVHLRVDRRAYEFARFWAAYHAGAEPTGTAEDHLEGYLNLALMEHMEEIDWMAPPDIEALYPKMPDKAPGDWDDDIPF
jgi:hypothetical protein